MPILAYPDGNDVIYYLPDGSSFKLIGGTRAWRNTNPGAIRDTALASSLGAIGATDGFAAFPSEEIGIEALKKMLQSASYSPLSIKEALTLHTLLTGTALTEYQNKIYELTQLPLDKQINTLNQIEVDSLVQAIVKTTRWVSGVKQDM